MKKRNLKNFIIIFLAFILCIGTGKLVSFAAENSRIVDDSFFDIDNRLLNEIKMMTAGMSKVEEPLTQSFVFLNAEKNSEIMPTPQTGNIDAEVYAKSVDFNKDDVLIGFISYSETNDILVDLVFDYISVEGNIPCFETQSGVIKGVQLNDSNAYSFVENGECILHLILDRDTLSQLSYYKNEAYNMYVLKPVSENEKLELNYLSATIAEGGFSFFKIIYNKNHCEIPVAAIDYSSCESNGNQAEYRLIGNEVSVNVVGNGKTIDIREVFNNDYTVATNGSYSFDAVEEIPACLLSGSSVTVSDDAETVKIDIMTIDIPEKEYQHLEEGSVSSVYRDTYVFANDNKENRVNYKSGSLGMDFFMHVFGFDGVVLPDLSEIIVAEELLGGSFGESILQQNMAIINVKNVRDSEYAGEMTFRSESNKLSSGISVSERRSVASPSDASRREEILGTEEKITADKIADSIIEKDSSDSVATDAVSGELNDSINYPSEFANANSYVFVKGNGAEYILKDQTVLLSEAFLRKASYCALDDCDTVIAFFNEHGRLITLADGYSEDDIASYVLMPVAEETENGRIDLDLCEISFLYNDMLLADGTYAEVIYYNDNIEAEEAEMYVSAYIDADSNIDLQFTKNLGLEEFEVFVEACNAEINLTSVGLYDVKCSSEPGTVVYVNGSEDYTSDTDISEYDGEYITIIDTENNYVESQVGSDTEAVEVNNFENNEDGDESEIHNSETAAENNVNVENTENTVDNRIDEISEIDIEENIQDSNAENNNIEMKSDFENDRSNSSESTNNTGEKTVEDSDQVRVSVADDNTEREYSVTHNSEGIDCENELPDNGLIDNIADNIATDAELEENSTEITENMTGFDENSDKSTPETNEKTENDTFEQIIQDSTATEPVLEPISELTVDLIGPIK